MTFSELILETRLRVHDYRQKDGVPITDASLNGIRWSSAQLQTLCKGALSNMVRTFSGLGNSARLENHMNLSVLTRLDDMDIVGTAGDYGAAVPPKDAYKILRIQENDDRTKIYLYVKPEVMLSKNWLAQNTETQESVFTVLRAEALTDKRSILVVPNPGDTVTVDADVSYEINPADLYTLVETEELPFQDIDDLILDYCEREARIIEHNQTQTQLLQAIIDRKLQELGFEIPRNKG